MTSSAALSGRQTSRRIELALRNFQRTSVCFGSWLCENSSGRATRRNISPGNCIPENHTAHARFDDLLENCVFYILRMYEFLHRVGQKPPWRHVASNVRFARKRTIRRATRSPRRRGPGYSGGTSRPRAREVFRLIMRLNWSAARSVAHPAACLLSGADHLRDYRHAPFPVRFIAAVQVELHPKNPEGCHPAYQTTCLPEPLDLATR